MKLPHAGPETEPPPEAQDDPELDLARRRDEIRSLANDVPVVIWTTDAQGRLTFINRRWTEITGQDAAAAAEGGGGFWNMAHPDDVARVTAAYHSAIRGQREIRLEYRLRTRQGDWIWVLDVGEPRRDAQGALLGYVGAVIDISERKVVEARLAQTAHRLGEVLESTGDSVIVIDREGAVSYFNSNASARLRPRRIRLGMPLASLFASEEISELVTQLTSAMRNVQPVQFETYVRPLRKWLEVRAFPSAEGLSLFFRDVSERRAAEDERRAAAEQLAHAARHDSLTGLPNRLAFGERMAEALRDRLPDETLALLYFDLDGFKEVNDTLGHAAGDEVLQAVSARLRLMLDPQTTIYRLSGDEFAVIRPSLPPSEATALAARIIELLNQPVQVDGGRVVIAGSVGVALAPDHGVGSEALLKAADVALYRAKAAGGGVCRVFDQAMAAALAATRALKADLGQALDLGLLRLAYQPLVNLSTGVVTGFEALLRCDHPRLASLPPARLIEGAEAGGLMIPIGQWAVREACRAAMAWPPHVAVAINLSAVQFALEGLVQNVESALRETGLPPERLQLEITESLPLRTDSENLRKLRALQRLGVTMVLDDFGTGYSSLSHLRAFPFARIKLDKSFVRDAGVDPQSEAIARAVASLGEGLGLKLTAEGIETADQARWLRQLNFSDGQGFLFSPAVDEAQARSLADHRFAVPN
ncbi:putative bifunctional diguanylate cyclase/phosphodiesterase [Phenylobacterium sp.]|uniref:putative bifunctional diguanylate cyclase/phosphodiesterase n=1 Tax=Phenylobacterium sp. TaxID=1871053 RepID=UPI0035AEA448